MSHVDEFTRHASHAEAMLRVAQFEYEQGDYGGAIISLRGARAAIDAAQKASITAKTAKNG
jgi:hypothetical protein